jgi:hypothetical protein
VEGLMSIVDAGTEPVAFSLAEFCSLPDFCAERNTGSPWENRTASVVNCHTNAMTTAEART